VTQLLLLKECVDISDHSLKEESRLKRFWKWETFEEYSKRRDI
jgi:hypothetical protein